MKQTRKRLLFYLALAALLAIFAGCKSESPTAPPSGGGTGGAGNPPGGGVVPPVGAALTLSVSNANPLIDSVSTITATVALNGQPVVNGTAVEFITNLGTFTDTLDVRTIRTTTNGVATAVLTSSEAGVATVSATVNNVTRTVQITFSESPVTPTPPSTAPTISSVTPNTGSPAGGTLITINGTNFRTPVRVIVDAGPAGSKEVFVQSVTPTQIVAVTPAINLAATQTQAAAITVIVDAGNPTEARVTRSAAFTYVTTNLTPIIRAISPTSGPIEGGTRITIVGDAFDAGGGVQVFFGAAQASVVSINFSMIIVTSPTARDTAPNGAGPVTGPVDIRIKNVASGKEVTAVGGFRYTPKAQITAIGPGAGTAFGGTRVTIDGSGFNAPVAISFAGIAAQPINVTGTQIIALTGRTPIPCAPPRGPTLVTNIDNGDGATGPEYAYAPELPAISSISPNSVEPLNNVTVRVAKPGVGIDGTAVIRFKLGDTTVIPTPSIITDPFGPIDFLLVVPDLTLPDETCTTSTGLEGTKKGKVILDVVFTNVTTTCTDTITKGLTVAPAPPNTCTAPPPPAPPSASVQPTTFCPNGFGSVTVLSTATQLLTVSNTAAAGSQNLVVSSIVVSGANAVDFTIAPPTVTVPPGLAAGVTIAFKPTALGTRTATVTLFTNDPANSTITVCVEGTGI